MKGFVITWLIYIYFIAAWIVNLVQFCNCDFDAPYKKEIIKGVGLCGLSAVTVWVCNDEK
jgi:hypothetical protein